jgi:hypothetical protein
MQQHLFAVEKKEFCTVIAYVCYEVQGACRLLCCFGVQRYC